MDLGLFVSILTLTLSFSLTGCRTLSGSPPEKDDPAKVTSASAPKKSPEDLDQLPQSLWSAAQRESTAGYYFMVAETMALKERDAAKALPYFEAAYNLDPNPYLGGKMIATKAASGDRGTSLSEARRMVLLYPSHAPLRYLYGSLLANANQLKKAADQFEECLSLDPKFEPAYLELIQVYQNDGAPEKALTVSKDLVTQIPSSVIGWSQLSRIYLTSHRYRDALTPAKRAWEMQSTNPQLTQIYAVTLQLNGRLKEAVQMYEQLFRLDPTDAELTSRMVAIYRDLGNLESALKLLSAVEMQGDRERPAVKMQKAIILWELKRHAEAYTLLKGLLAAYPESDRIKYLAAFGAERVTKPEEAMALYRAIPESSPLYFEAHARVILLLRGENRWDDALELARTLVEKPGTTVESAALIASIFADGERPREALDILNPVLKKDPDNPRLLFLKGSYLEKLGERAECIEVMREVIRLDPESSSALNFLGYLFAERGERLDEAEELIKKALTLKPNDGFYTDSLGWVYYQKKDFKKALEALEKAVSLEPEEGVILEHLADTLLKLGRTQEAQERLEQALKVKLETKDRDRIRLKLKEWGGSLDP